MLFIQVCIERITKQNIERARECITNETQKHSK